jgi:2-iminobutanoate/2-iminopropanoate deaminase
VSIILHTPRRPAADLQRASEKRNLYRRHKTVSTATKRQAITAPIVANPLLSHAVRVGDLVFTSGFVAIDPETGKPVGGDIRAQTQRVIENLKLVLEAAGTTLDEAVKATVYLRNWEDFEAFNDVYHEYFPQEPPGRTCTQAGRLGGQFLVEIELIIGSLLRCLACMANTCWASPKD